MTLQDPGSLYALLEERKNTMYYPSSRIRGGPDNQQILTELREAMCFQKLGHKREISFFLSLLISHSGKSQSPLHKSIQEALRKVTGREIEVYKQLPAQERSYSERGSLAPVRPSDDDDQASSQVRITHLSYPQISNTQKTCVTISDHYC